MTVDTAVYPVSLIEQALALLQQSIPQTLHTAGAQRTAKRPRNALAGGSFYKPKVPTKAQRPTRAKYLKCPTAIISLLLGSNARCWLWLGRLIFRVVVPFNDL